MTTARLMTAALLIVLLTACDQAETTYMVGTLERDRVELKVESNEPIVEIAVQDGQAVKPGPRPSAARAVAGPTRPGRGQAGGTAARAAR